RLNRIPHRVHAVRPARVRQRERGLDGSELSFVGLERWIDQHESAAFGGWQQGAQGGITVALVHVHAWILAEQRAQRSGFAVLRFAKDQAIACLKTSAKLPAWKAWR